MHADTLTPHDDLATRRLAGAFIEGDETTAYWTDGKKVRYRHFDVRGADADSFLFYLGAFAKDARHCYCTSRRLTGADPATFRMLNFTWACDDAAVWCLGGRVKDADVRSFEVCDQGFVAAGASHQRAPAGYAKDRNHVYFYNFDGKANVVKKAEPASFVSHGDGSYAHDAQWVFWEHTRLPKADPGSWRRLEGLYSRDSLRLYYCNREVKGADLPSFKTTLRGFLPLARDSGGFFRGDVAISEEEYFRLLQPGRYAKT